MCDTWIHTLWRDCIHCQVSFHSSCHNVINRKIIHVRAHTHSVTTWHNLLTPFFGAIFPLWFVLPSFQVPLEESHSKIEISPGLIDQFVYWQTLSSRWARCVYITWLSAPADTKEKIKKGGYNKGEYQGWYVDLIIRIKPFRLVLGSITDRDKGSQRWGHRSDYQRWFFVKLYSN